MEEDIQYAKPLSVKDWLVTFLLLAIPVVGIVMLFIYAFGSAGNPNRRNWAKANLIFSGIITILMIILYWTFRTDINFILLKNGFFGNSLWDAGEFIQ